MKAITLRIVRCSEDVSITEEDPVEEIFVKDAVSSLRTCGANTKIYLHSGRVVETDLLLPMVTQAFEIGKETRGSKVYNRPKVNYSKQFEELWDVYPMQVDKAEAFREYEKLRQHKELPSGLPELVELFKKHHLEGKTMGG
jgi:hypothetical protein